MIRPQIEECAKAATERSISPASRMLIGITSTLSDGATAWMIPNKAGPPGLAGSRSTAARVISGAISLSSSSHFPLRPYSNPLNPVALPPGRARLSTMPAPTGSTAVGNTIGTVRVTCSNDVTDEAPWARMTSGASAANSAACRRTSAASVAQRVSIRRPMVQPNSASPCTNAWNRLSEFLSLPNCAVERIQETVTANAAMPLVAGEDVRTPLGAFRVVFGIGQFDNQINFGAPTIRPTLAKDEAATAPEVLKPPTLLVHLSGTGRRKDSNHETLLHECRLEAARYRVTDTHRWGWHHAEHNYF